MSVGGDDDEAGGRMMWMYRRVTRWITDESLIKDRFIKTQLITNADYL